MNYSTVRHCILEHARPSILRRLFVVDQVMPEKVARLFSGLVEDMGGAGIDDDLEIGLACDRLTFSSWCPVVFLVFSSINTRTGTDGPTPSLMAASSIMIAWFFLTFHIAGTTLTY